MLVSSLICRPRRIRAFVARGSHEIAEDFLKAKIFGNERALIEGGRKMKRKNLISKSEKRKKDLVGRSELLLDILISRLRARPLLLRGEYHTVRKHS